LFRPGLRPLAGVVALGDPSRSCQREDQQWDKALADNHTLERCSRLQLRDCGDRQMGLGGDDKGGTTPAEWPAYPTRRGFDYFFGYERHGDGHDHYPKEAIYSNRSKQCYDGTNNITPKLDKCYTADLFTARAKSGSPTSIRPSGSTVLSLPGF